MAPPLAAIGRALFRDRGDAGEKLAARLASYSAEFPVIVALPRGGVPVAREVSDALGAPLDVVLVRKLGAPLQPEYGIGAVGEEDVVIIRQEAVAALGVEEQQLSDEIARERAELERRARLYRGERQPVPVAGRFVIMVDDGIATGGTATAGARVLRGRGASRVVLAVPVAPPQAAERLRDEVDEFICLEAPEDFFAVGQFYEQFEQVGDAEVQELLGATETEPEIEPSGAAAETAEADPPPHLGGLDWAQVAERAVEIPAGEARLPGDLRLPPSPQGLVIFAHGSGSSRLSPRNRQVAAALNGAGLATLLFDLLSERESLDRANVFDVEQLSRRLVATTRWAQRESGLRELPIGYFGASTGAAAALCAAAELGDDIRAVVSRGGRPDLAAERLSEVTAPTLLIVGGDDLVVLELNEQAARLLIAPRELSVVPHATHLFEEPGALDRVTALASAWFSEHL